MSKSKIALAKLILDNSPFCTEARRELAHAIEYAVSAPGEHSEKRLIAAVNANRAANGGDPS